MGDKPKTNTVPVAPVGIDKIAELRATLIEALKLDNDSYLIIAAQIAREKKAIAEATVKVALAESEKLSGVRLALTADLYKQVKQGIQGVTKQLEGVKATGFSFILAYEADGAIVKEHIALMVPTVKARKAGGGGGGKISDQTGMSRADLVSLHATEAEKAAIATAEAGATSRKDSARYQAQKPVVKRILADHPELIRK